MERAHAVYNEAVGSVKDTKQAVSEWSSKRGAEVSAKARELLDKEKSEAVLKSGKEKVEDFLHLGAIKQSFVDAYNWVKGKVVGSKVVVEVPANKSAGIKSVHSEECSTWCIAAVVGVLVALGVTGYALRVKMQKKGGKDVSTRKKP